MLVESFLPLDEGDLRKAGVALQVGEVLGDRSEMAAVTRSTAGELRKKIGGRGQVILPVDSGIAQAVPDKRVLLRERTDGFGGPPRCRAHYVQAVGHRLRHHRGEEAVAGG